MTPKEINDALAGRNPFVNQVFVVPAGHKRYMPP